MSDPTPDPLPAPRPGVLGRFVPPLLVVAAIAGTAYWGQRTEWTFTHSQPAAETPIADPVAQRPVVNLQPARVEFASAEAVAVAGIDISLVWESRLTEQVSASGEVGFDPTRVARVPARSGGTTVRVLKSVGEAIRAGDVLAVVDAPEVGKAKTEFQQALVQGRLREKTRDDLTGAGAATSPAALREAEAAVKDAAVRTLAAAQRLTNLGLSVEPKDYKGLSVREVADRLRQLTGDPSATSDNLLPVRSPFAGVVLQADVVAGEVVEAGKPLFVVVDPSRVVVTFHVPAEDARRLTVGQAAFFRPDGGAGEHPARVISVGTAADETTRTVPVRAEADNTGGKLRAATLGRGRVVFRDVPQTLVVPREAVHTFQGQSVVFVRDPDFLKAGGPKAFHVRVVRTGGRDDRNLEILAGLAAREIVATKNSGVLLAELTHAADGR